MVDRENLIIDISAHGSVVYCDENSEVNYVVVMEGVTSNKITLDIIVDGYVSADYGGSSLSTLSNGVYKCDYSK